MITHSLTDEKHRAHISYLKVGGSGSGRGKVTYWPSTVPLLSYVHVLKLTRFC